MQVPIPTLHLFPTLDRKLIELLSSLKQEDWKKPTRAKLWSVKDVATHLLDTNIRTISASRDHYFPEVTASINSYGDLVQYLNDLNAAWVQATKCLSPVVLIDLLTVTGKQYREHLQTLDPYGEAIFSVAWAGETKSLNWFHIAREYTEKWHHQQQIREAVGGENIYTPDLYKPVLQTFMLALPYHYRNMSAVEGSCLRVNITGNAGGTWLLKYENATWKFDEKGDDVITEISIDEEEAWKLFTKGLTQSEAEKVVHIVGDTTLGKGILSMLSVMA